MSQTVEQIYIANPSSTMISTDLLYLVHSPYTTGNDSAITWGNMQSSITATGTIASGTWHGSIIAGTYGGTGVNNGVSTFTFGGNVAFSGAYTFTGTLTGNTAVTFPTSGTLATTSQIVTWTDVTSGTQSLSANSGYITDNGASLVTYTLPATAALGSIIEIVGKSAGGWTIVYGSGQIIHFGNETTTVTSGSLSSTNQWDYVKLICVTANTAFSVIGGVGNLTGV